MIGTTQINNDLLIGLEKGKIGEVSNNFQCSITIAVVLTLLLILGMFAIKISIQDKRE